MKMKFISMAMVMAFVTVLHYSCSSPAGALMSTLGSNPQLSGITSLLKGAGGLGSLVGKGPFTLLAPSNNALSSLGAGALENLLKPENKSTLQGILKKHILPGKFTADQINAGGMKDALGNALNLGGAKITESIPTKGGLVQVIDGIIK
jgi:uncharacterized surface protein with fasciclin (FAS1) repeats